MKRLSLVIMTLFVLAPLQAASQSPREEAAEILSRFGHEPTVLDVQAAAALYARVNPEAYGRWQGQASWANVLPERLSGEAYHLTRDEKDVRTTQSTLSQSETVALDAHSRFKVLAEWDLSRLIFNPDNLDAAREVSRLVERREDLLTTVNKLYFARRQLQAELALQPPDDPKRALRAQLRLAGLTADLDALTGGWFSQQVTARLLGGRSGRAAAGSRVTLKAHP